ncbi:hypothetical protein PQJ75_02355 [Rhodoplanes sp. TEM]|uniref:ParB/Sulfiredoxin domain-containing protein n=1 Tax=Rhodoplanes tepidamans TaxID=200616 RepID=A0ABT5J7T7_RHOTP|nr:MULTISPECIES: hypothetical protein [Rhodoplanes]MDC7785090.1 hypothetical protein [Rhodoplanes tepidamans]MDC7982564.1 hypothetical protein [Rhodoplanes sp. TEM]MDQ0356580.1 hypothetical protein [Rhodoplanes tepidamans]
MFAGFKYESVPLKEIVLDDRNPRIVSQTPLSSQSEIVSYLYENEDLEAFIKKISSEGKNIGAERPYVVKKGSGYVVVEGNTRIAAYKLLTGLMKPPKDYAGTIPHISENIRNSLLKVDCSIAPNRDAMMPIMASAHFGTGDKSKWGYLGSRKAVYDEWKSGKSLPKLAKLFNVAQSEIKELILEYQLYLKSLSLSWTPTEKEILLKPNLAFNPPVRFLQTSGHKEKVGISYDTVNLKVVLGKDADKKFKHLLQKLVISPVKGLGATASYEAVFADYGTAASSVASGGKKASAASNSGSSGKQGPANAKTGGGTSSAPKPGSLFGYSIKKINNALVAQLLKEAREINCKKYPAAATFLLRNITETILKHIIDDQGANKNGAKLDLENSLNLCISQHVKMSQADKNILSEFKKDHLNYLNLGAHGNVIPNDTRVLAARDTIDQFVKKHV